MAESKTVPLTAPITVGGRPIDSVTIRRPRVGDLRRMDAAGKTNLDKTLWLIGALAELTPEEVDQIDAHDLTAIGAVVADFTGVAG